MAKRIIALLLISLAYSCTSTHPVVVEEKKPVKYRVVVNKTNGEKIISKTQ
jgi:hypothetical protein